MSEPKETVEEECERKKETNEKREHWYIVYKLGFSTATTNESKWINSEKNNTKTDTQAHHRSANKGTKVERVRQQRNDSDSACVWSEIK